MLPNTRVNRRQNGLHVHRMLQHWTYTVVFYLHLSKYSTTITSFDFFLRAVGRWDGSSERHQLILKEVVPVWRHDVREFHLLRVPDSGGPRCQLYGRAVHRGGDPAHHLSGGACRQCFCVSDRHPDQETADSDQFLHPRPSRGRHSGVRCQHAGDRGLVVCGDLAAGPHVLSSVRLHQHADPVLQCTITV